MQPALIDNRRAHRGSHSPGHCENEQQKNYHVVREYSFHKSVSLGMQVSSGYLESGKWLAMQVASKALPDSITPVESVIESAF
jgi:hypothetical protein